MFMVILTVIQARNIIFMMCDMPTVLYIKLGRGLNWSQQCNQHTSKSSIRTIIFDVNLALFISNFETLSKLQVQFKS